MWYSNKFISFSVTHWKKTEIKNSFDSQILEYSECARQLLHISRYNCPDRSSLIDERGIIYVSFVNVCVRSIKWMRVNERWGNIKITFYWFWTLSFPTLVIHWHDSERHQLKKNWLLFSWKKKFPFHNHHPIRFSNLRNLRESQAHFHSLHNFLSAGEEFFQFRNIFNLTGSFVTNKQVNELLCLILEDIHPFFIVECVSIFRLSV